MSKNKKQKKGTQVVNLPDDSLLDGQQLITLAKQNKQLRNVNSNYQIDGNDFKLTDISIEESGESEDYIYANDQFLRQNIRRGLSVLISFQNSKESDYLIIRRGLMKFFDIYWEFLDEETHESWVTNNKIQKQIKDLTFKNVVQQLRDKNSVIITETEKANGENCQISFNLVLNSWIICSKNCSMVAINQNKQKNSRFNLVEKIYQSWVEILSQFNEEQISHLKLFLSDKTIIGEFIGHPEHLHIVKYNRAQIKFYAIVQNDSMDTCIAQSETFKKFEELKLPMVEFCSHNVTSENSLFEKLKYIYNSTSSSPIDQQGEGKVLYFESEQKCISIGKLKTLECMINYKYFSDRILRKLREKLRFAISSKKNQPKILTKFFTEIQELCQFNQPKNHPIAYYFEMGKIAFELIETQNNKFLQMINENFMEFLSVIQNQIDEQKFSNIFQQEEQKESQAPPKNQNITVLIPLTIPACGKSFLVQNILEHLQEKGLKKLDFFSISSDTVRQKLMEEFMMRNKAATSDEAHDRTTKPYKGAYENELINKFQEAKQSKSSKVLIFIDKNHPINALDGIMKILQKNKIPKANIVGVLPLCQNLYKDYPFSLTFLCHCINNVLNRGEHLTLNGDENFKVSVVISLFKFFRGVRIEDFNQKFERLLLFPFSIEDNDKEQQLREKISHLLVQICKFKDPNEMKEIIQLQELIDIVKSYEWPLPSLKVQLTAVQDFIEIL